MFISEEDKLELINNILEWWKEHEYDVVSTLDDEYNLYDDVPTFVTIAKQIKEKQRMKK